MVAVAIRSALQQSRGQQVNLDHILVRPTSIPVHLPMPFYMDTFEGGRSQRWDLYLRPSSHFSVLRDGHIPSSSRHRYIRQTGGVTRCATLLLHRPDAFVTSQSGTRHFEGAAAIAPVQPIHGRHQIGLVHVLA